MGCFVYSGKKRIVLRLKPKNAKSLLRERGLPRISGRSIKNRIRAFFGKNQNVFCNKKVCLVIPDNTRDFHPRLTLQPLLKHLKGISKKVDCIISLGLHRKLSSEELQNFLGRSIIENNKVIQHSNQDVKPLASIMGIPSHLNKHIFNNDVILTVGVVESHLYSGFSGGIKCIAIGLAGKKTILGTHSTDFLSRKGIKVSNIAKNPFQNFLWATIDKIGTPVYSLNIVNNHSGGISFFTIGEAKKSFAEAVDFAKRAYRHKVKEKFDVVFIGCDFPKDKSLYQASRLFNYVLDKKRLVKKGGFIFVFADPETRTKGRQERTFENVLKKSRIPSGYSFKKPGEHRAFKVIEACKYAELGIVTSNKIDYKGIHCISFFEHYNRALRKVIEKFGKDIKIGIIPFGFRFIPH